MIHEDKIKQLDAPTTLERSGVWSCFYCLKTFNAVDAFAESRDWHCPNCGIPSVISMELDSKTLDIINHFWFERGVQISMANPNDKPIKFCSTCHYDCTESITIEINNVYHQIRTSLETKQNLTIGEQFIFDLVKDYEFIDLDKGIDF